MITINKNVRIGKVIFIVEGQKVEPKIIRDIFQKIFDFEIYQTNKKEDVIRLSKSNDIYSKVVIITNNKPQLSSLLKENEYIDNIFKLLQNNNMSPYDSAVYYLFDRDENNIEIITSLINKFTNSRESNDFDINGLLLLSYPCVEAFYMNCNCDNYKPSNRKLLKRYVNVNRYKKIDERKIINGVSTLLDILLKELSINFKINDLDNFKETNTEIFERVEHYCLENNSYIIISLLFFALLDLGLIEIE